MKDMLEIRVELENGGSTYIFVSSEQLVKIAELEEPISKIDNVKVIPDKEILVTRKCGECGTYLEVAMKRTEKDTNMLCHHCGHFTPVSLYLHEKLE